MHERSLHFHSSFVKMISLHVPRAASMLSKGFVAASRIRRIIGRGW